MKTNAIFLISIFCLLPGISSAEEYIQSFHSEIEVRRNGNLQVTETILVSAEGRQIKRGIFRDFPTIYSDQSGASKRVGFEVLSVYRDGLEEDYSTKNRSNGKRLYVGHKDRFLSPGFYEYKITYRTTRQLGFFESFDELYWNVTGTGWSFPINQASARITLPADIESFELTGYTGSQGSTAQNLLTRQENSRQAYFETTQSLARNQGLTIVAGWPKGIVNEPSNAQLREQYIEDNLSNLIAMAGFGGLVLYYWLVWLRVGRDPKRGIIIPLYAPPKGYSPASMRFIARMAYDKKCFTAAIVNLAAKGALMINNENDEFSIEKSEQPLTQPLAAGEAGILKDLLGNQLQLTITRTQHSQLSSAINQHKKSLQSDYEKLYFVNNIWHLSFGVLLSIITIGLVIKNLPDEELLVAAVVSTLGIFIPLMMVVTGIYRIINRERRGKIQFGINLLSIAIFGTIIFQSEFKFDMVLQRIPWSIVISVIGMLLMNYLFYHWLKAPTLAGRKLLDRIDGFRQYLQVAEADEIEMKNEPRFTTDIYERYLPYAIALDLENQWTDRLNSAIAAGLVASSYHQPIWYRGRGNQHFSKGLSKSMNSAIASSSVAPGSSSGSSGGSSGGGGGGGGGGGW